MYQITYKIKINFLMLLEGLLPFALYKALVKCRKKSLFRSCYLKKWYIDF